MTLPRSLPLVLAAALALAAAPSAQSVPGWAAPQTAAPAAPAQAGVPCPPGQTGPGCTGAPPTQSVPLDGGLGLLAAAGGLYAARRLRRAPAA